MSQPSAPRYWLVALFIVLPVIRMAYFPAIAAADEHRAGEPLRRAAPNRSAQAGRALIWRWMERGDRRARRAASGMVSKRCSRSRSLVVRDAVADFALDGTLVAFWHCLFGKRPARKNPAGDSSANGRPALRSNATPSMP